MLKIKKPEPENQKFGWRNVVKNVTNKSKDFLLDVNSSQNMSGGCNEKVHEVELQNKKKFNWFSVSASAAYGDKIFLGFGNGALAILDTLNITEGNRCNLPEIYENFTGKYNKTVDKIQIMYMETSKIS